MIVRVDVIDVFRRDELMLDEDGWRNRPAMKDIQGHGDDVGAVLFGEVGDRSDQARAWCAKLGAAFRGRVLTHDRAALAAPGFLQRAQCTERAWVIDRANQKALRTGRPQMSPHGFEALAQLAVPFEIRDLAVLE